MGQEHPCLPIGISNKMVFTLTILGKYSCSLYKWHRQFKTYHSLHFSPTRLFKSTSPLCVKCPTEQWNPSHQFVQCNRLQILGGSCIWATYQGVYQGASFCSSYSTVWGGWFEYREVSLWSSGFIDNVSKKNCATILKVWDTSNLPVWWLKELENALHPCQTKQVSFRKSGYQSSAWLKNWIFIAFINYNIKCPTVISTPATQNNKVNLVCF